MSNANNWPISGRGFQIVATSASGATRIEPIDQPSDRMLPDVFIDNPGPSDVFVAAGDASVVATLLSVRVSANSLQSFFKGKATHLACIAPSGLSQPLVVRIGDGA